MEMLRPSSSQEISIKKIGIVPPTIGATIVTLRVRRLVTIITPTFAIIGVTTACKSDRIGRQQLQTDGARCTFQPNHIPSPWTTQTPNTHLSKSESSLKEGVPIPKQTDDYPSMMHTAPEINPQNIFQRMNLARPNNVNQIERYHLK
jgi:hypothetical protein